MSFKLKHSGVPALMKTLTAGQKNMVQSMRKAGKTEAADKIQRGIEKAPIKKGPGDKNKHKTSQKLRRNESGTVIGTASEEGMTQPIGTQRGVNLMSQRKGELFNEDGSLKRGKNVDMMKNLIKSGNKVYGYVDPSGKPVRFKDSRGNDQPFDMREFKRASQVGGYYTGTGFKSRHAQKMAKRFFDHNTGVDKANRAVDRARMIKEAEGAGDRIQYNKEKETPKRAVAAAPKKLGVKGLAKKAAPKKRGVKGLAKKAAPKKYGCKKK